MNLKNHSDDTRRVILPYPTLPSQSNKSSELNIQAQLHQCLLQALEGRLYPEFIPVESMERVLDLGCGVGEWIFDLAKLHPHLHIHGIDAREEALRLAKIRRNISGLRQIEFRQIDHLEPLPLADQYLDFIHIRRCTHFIAPPLWPRVIEECVRTLRPSGWLLVVEMELCEISSPAYQEIHRITLQARNKLCQTLHSSETIASVAPRLYNMLLQTSLDEVGYDLHTIDLGFLSGNTGYIFLAEILRHAFLMKPLVVQQGLLDAAEFDELIAQARKELQAPDLCGWAILLSVYGRRDSPRKR